jgi:hypothetical protein
MRVTGGDRVSARALARQLAADLAGLALPANGRSLGRLVLRLAPQPGENGRELARRVGRRIAEALK